MSFIDSDAPNIIKYSVPNYGGGFQGVPMKDSSKWGNHGKIAKARKLKIYLSNYKTQRTPR